MTVWFMEQDDRILCVLFEEVGEWVTIDEEHGELEQIEGCRQPELRIALNLHPASRFEHIPFCLQLYKS